jgi:hypothetical protein
MGWGRWVAPVAATCVVIVASAGKASAHLESDNGCQGSGTFREDGLTVDAESIGDEVVKIPREDTVDWQGSVDAPPGAYSGTIAIDLPPPFGEAEIDSWSGESDNTANAGERDYDLPSVVPAGVEFQVVGSHTDENGSCSGFVNLEIKGGPFDSPLAPASLVGTVAAGVGLAFTVRPLFRGVPS